MVRNRHAPGGVILIPFAPPAGTPAGIEVMTLATLRSRTTPAHLSALQRPAFHHLLNITTGDLRQTVDFTDYALRPGGWLWTRPNQVVQWGDISRTEGTLILFQQDFLDPATMSAARADDPFGPAHVTLGTIEQQVLHQAADHLATEFTAYGRMPPDIHLTAVRHLLAALVLRLSHAITPIQRKLDGPTQIFQNFRAAVELHYTTSRTVEDYATRLGYSPRTITRASTAIAGTGAKEFVDQRVILEAKRLLAHTNHTAAQIAARLGFATPTNFNKYFHQRTHQTPLAFRAAARSTPSRA